jgi:hypothetical protein
MSVIIRVSKRKRKNEPALIQIIKLIAIISWLISIRLYRWLKQKSFTILSIIYDRLKYEDQPDIKPVDKPVELIKPVVPYKPVAKPKSKVVIGSVSPGRARIKSYPQPKSPAKIELKPPVEIENKSYPHEDQPIELPDHLKKKVLSAIGETEDLEISEPDEKQLKDKAVYDRRYRPKPYAWL